MILNFSFLIYKGIFALPSDIVDKYINEASGEDLKVLLYIFRHANDEIELEKSCEELSMEETSFKKAVNFWVKKKVFKCTKDKAEQTEAKKTHVRTAAQKVIASDIEYSQKEISGRMDTDSNIKFLLESAQNQFGKLLSPAECSKLVYLYEGAGLPVDVIVLMIGYCRNISKMNIRFIEHLGLNWVDSGIDTYDKAEKRIEELENGHSFEGKVRSMLGINGRALTEVEKKFLHAWNAMNLTPELVKSAYDITIARTGKLSFNYMDKILSDWNEKGIKTPEEAKKEKNSKKKSKASKSPSFDVDEYVSLSMKNLYNE